MSARRWFFCGTEMRAIELLGQWSVTILELKKIESGIG